MKQNRNPPKEYNILVKKQRDVKEETHGNFTVRKHNNWKAPCMGLISECREQEEKNKKQKTTERMIEIIQSVTKRKCTEENKKWTGSPENSVQRFQQ